MLDEEISDDSVATMADYFKVSERVVQTELVNKGRLHRSDLEPDIEVGVEAAA